jgi:hypothetical protein
MSISNLQFKELFGDYILAKDAVEIFSNPKNFEKLQPYKYHYREEGLDEHLECHEDGFITINGEGFHLQDLFGICHKAIGRLNNLSERKPCINFSHEKFKMSDGRNFKINCEITLVRKVPKRPIVTIKLSFNDGPFYDVIHDNPNEINVAAVVIKENYLFSERIAECSVELRRKGYDTIGIFGLSSFDGLKTSTTYWQLNKGTMYPTSEYNEDLSEPLFPLGQGLANDKFNGENCKNQLFTVRLLANDTSIKKAGGDIDSLRERVESISISSVKPDTCSCVKAGGGGFFTLEKGGIGLNKDFKYLVSFESKTNALQIRMKNSQFSTAIDTKDGRPNPFTVPFQIDKLVYSKKKLTNYVKEGDNIVLLIEKSRITFLEGVTNRDVNFVLDFEEVTMLPVGTVKVCIM